MKSSFILVSVLGLLTSTVYSLGLNFTFYSLAHEDIDSGEGPKNVSIFDCNQTHIANVSEGFIESVRIAGTGKLLDGRLIDISCHKINGSSCYEVLPADFKWGLNTNGRDLQVYTSVAAKPGRFNAG